MNEYFTGAIIEIRLDTGVDLSTASQPKVRYTKPNGNSGTWNASKSGNEVVYLTSSSDIDIPGTWRFEASVFKDGGTKYGKIVYVTFKTPL